MSIVSVAKRAGVSVATVSRVLNDLNNVRAETVEQVRAAMQELNYTPPRIKRGPKAGHRRVMPPGMRTGQIAVLNLGGTQGWLSLPVMSNVVAGVMRAAKELDICPVLDEMPDPDVLSPILRRREVDAAVVFFRSGLAEERLVALREQLPIVWLMGAEVGAPDVDHVTPDNMNIGHLAFKYLAQHGCRRVAFVNDNQPGLPIMRLRGQAFGNAARDAGLSVENFLVNVSELEATGYSGKVHAAPSLPQLVDLLASLDERPTGLFVATDRLTTELYPLLLQRGIKPEEDVRIISCDNEQERLCALWPRPASIDLRTDELGRWAVRQLVHRIQRPEGAAARIQVAPRIAPIPLRPR